MTKSIRLIALRLAKEHIKVALHTQGHKLSWYKASDIKLWAIELIKADKMFMRKAKRIHTAANRV